MVAAGYSFLGSMGQMNPHDAYKIVHRYADKALQLDNSVAEGHVAKGVAYLLYDWEFERAHASLQKALELNPNAQAANQMMSFYYIMKSRYEDAIKILQPAVELDPLSPSIICSLAEAYFINGQNDEAIQQIDRLLEMNPEMRAAIEMKGWAVGMKGDWSAALELFKDVHRLTRHPLKGLSPLGYAYAMVGEREKALECIRKIKQREIEEPDIVIDGDLVGIYFALGDMDKAFYHINQCIEKRVGPPEYYLEYPMLRKLKKDPRYKALLERAHERSPGAH
jgi:adenylate cyclase